jgi:hypothetical protein
MMRDQSEIKDVMAGRLPIINVLLQEILVEKTQPIQAILSGNGHR